ncbi:50S ribosomal protein L2 [Candidatus Woesearchaeota archaeon]|nr:50S ribosomal protein L2 [Candidatus Woesearchaeota archaeon]
MGKNLIQQRRGKGTSLFRAGSFRSKGDVKTPTKYTDAKVVDIVTSTHHSAPLMKVKYPDGKTGHLIAPEGMKVGDKVTFGGDVERGNTLQLKDIPVGTLIHNVEATPGDGGKFIRGSGVVGRVLGQKGDSILVLLPSKKRKTFHPTCRATLGVIAGGGRKEKPLLKAGVKFHKMRAKNKYYPKVSGTAMNAVAHPFGGKRSGRKGRPTIAPKNAPPGKKVGMIRPRKTGRARGTRVRTS